MFLLSLFYLPSKAKVRNCNECSGNRTNARTHTHTHTHTKTLVALTNIMSGPSHLSDIFHFLRFFLQFFEDIELQFEIRSRSCPSHPLEVDLFNQTFPTPILSTKWFGPAQIFCITLVSHFWDQFGFHWILLKFACF